MIVMGRVELGVVDRASPRPGAVKYSAPGAIGCRYLYEISILNYLSLRIFSRRFIWLSRLSSELREPSNSWLTLCSLMERFVMISYKSIAKLIVLPLQLGQT